LEPLLHVVVPFTALILSGVKPHKAAPLAVLGVLPDLDALLLLHRSLSHSAVILSLAWAPILAFAYFRPEYRKTAALALLVLLSHPVLDMMGSSTPILWPLLDTSIHLKLSLNGKIGDGVSLSPHLEVQRTATVFEQVASIDYPLFTGEGLMISLLLLTPIALNFLWERRSAGRLNKEI
jgi:membrane-bound metal-dependent hydrolase YbcI (DUF457 family)